MISSLYSDKLNETKNNLIITYPRNVSIIFGHYPCLDIVHNMILEIKNNLNPEMKNYTNVKGGMTDWKFFLDKKNFNHFISFLINKHQSSHSDMFKYFLEKWEIDEAWGNEIKKGDSVKFHHHLHHSGILYLTKGCDLILPELNIKITPKPGDYYILPPVILHGFEKSFDKNNRYSLIFNMFQHSKKFDFNKKFGG